MVLSYPLFRICWYLELTNQKGEKECHQSTFIFSHRHQDSFFFSSPSERENSCNVCIPWISADKLEVIQRIIYIRIWLFKGWGRILVVIHKMERRCSDRIATASGEKSSLKNLTLVPLVVRHLWQDSGGQWDSFPESERKRGSVRGEGMRKLLRMWMKMRSEDEKCTRENSSLDSWEYGETKGDSDDDEDDQRGRCGATGYKTSRLKDAKRCWWWCAVDVKEVRRIKVNGICSGGSRMRRWNSRIKVLSLSPFFHSPMLYYVQLLKLTTKHLSFPPFGNLSVLLLTSFRCSKCSIIIIFAQTMGKIISE